MKEENQSFLLFFLFLEKERGWGEGGMGPVPFYYGRHSYLSAVRNYRSVGGKGKAWAYLYPDKTS